MRVLHPRIIRYLYIASISCLAVGILDLIRGWNTTDLVNAVLPIMHLSFSLVFYCTARHQEFRFRLWQAMKEERENEISRTKSKD